MLREKLQVIQSSADGLEKITVAPRMEVILRVLNYARETSVEPVQHT